MNQSLLLILTVLLAAYAFRSPRPVPGLFRGLICFAVLAVYIYWVSQL